MRRLIGFFAFVGGGVFGVYKFAAVDPATLAGIGWPMVAVVVAGFGFLNLVVGNTSTSDGTASVENWASDPDPIEYFGPNHFADEQFPHSGGIGFNQGEVLEREARRGVHRSEPTHQAGGIAAPEWPVQQPIPVPPQWTRRGQK